MSDGPLAGVTVVVTRPAAQAPALATLIERAGGIPVVVPLIEVVPTDPAVLRAALHEVAADWIVVTSPNAAAAVRHLLTGHPARIAAVGSATAAELDHVDLVPDVQRATGVVDALADGPGHVVVVQSAEGAPTLTEGLAAKGWTVHRVDSHRPVARRPDPAEERAARAARSWIVTSGSQARAWVAAFGAFSPPVVVSIGPQTTLDCQAAGLKVSVTAADHTLPGAVNALVRAIEPSPLG